MTRTILQQADHLGLPRTDMTEAGVWVRNRLHRRKEARATDDYAVTACQSYRRWRSFTDPGRLFPTHLMPGSN